MKSLLVRVVVSAVSAGMVAMLAGGARAADKAATLEGLLTAADLQKIGVKDVVLAEPDAYDRVTQLGFDRPSTSTMVLVLSRLDPSAPGELKTTLDIISKDVAAVPGVGDEAYSFLGGIGLAFRKGKNTLQLMSGLDPGSGNACLGKDQLAEAARVICGRL